MNKNIEQVIKSINGQIKETTDYGELCKQQIQEVYDLIVAMPKNEMIEEILEELNIKIGETEAWMKARQEELLAEIESLQQAQDILDKWEGK